MTKLNIMKSGTGHILFLSTLALFSTESSAAGCTEITHGYYLSSQASHEACMAMTPGPGNYCWGRYDSRAGLYFDGNLHLAYDDTGDEIWAAPAYCSQLANSPHLEHITYTTNRFYEVDECPEGLIEEGTECVDPQCQAPTRYNSSTGLCEKECPADKPWNDTARDCVAPPEPNDCSNMAGNPIDFYSGHKIQTETLFKLSGNFPLSFTWHYNSFGNHHKSGAGYSVGYGLSDDTILHTEPPISGGQQRVLLPLNHNPEERYMGGAHYKWRHSHSYYLGHYTGTNGSQERVIAYRPNGIDLHFFNENGKYISLANRQWTLTKEVDSEQQHIGWTLQVGNIIEKYDTQGRVLRVENEQGQGVSYTYKSNGTKLDVVADDNGSTLTFNSYYKEQPSRITLNDGTVYSFSYESDGLLRSISYPATSYTTKNFYYEDPRFRQALTSIKDERGNIYATFVYDERGRAIHSEHAGGADSIDIEYIDKNTRRLTNALGKQTTYHYSDVDGAKRITLVQGEASTNCAAANQTYTYDVNGFVSSQTDWNGITTTYVHNARGLETSRTEAAGTPEARTITTEWHPEFRLPVRITEPDQITEFTYDDQGRLLSRDERSVQ